MTFVNVLRAAFSIMLLTSVFIIGAGYANRYELRGFDKTVEEGDLIADPANNVTVIGTQGTGNTKEWVQRAGDSPGEIIALNSSGHLLYYNNTYQAYWDIDPVPSGKSDVMYVASEFRTAEECGSSSTCFVNHVEVVNLTTGKTDRLYSKTVRNERSVRWHDVERYTNTTIVVGDIAHDRVFIVNTTTGIINWEWEMESAFPVSYGGSFPSDWSHLNDVEVLPDGRIMVSLRNQDSVVFLDQETGIQKNWTVGSNDAYEILHEQHNPDYIPEERGGPAVLVSDSENNRIVEYQRENEAWERTWSWRSPKTNWPRDADRLPNGHTLITDTNSNRVIEVNQQGKIIWSFGVKRPYEAERLETGPESAGGKSAGQLGLESQTASRGGPPSRQFVRSLVPEAIVGAINFIRPRWMTMLHVVSSFVLVATILMWSMLEYYASSYALSLQSPVEWQRN